MSSKGLRHVYITIPNFTSMYNFQGTDRQILKGRFFPKHLNQKNTHMKTTRKCKNWWKSTWKWSLGENFHQLGSSCIRAIVSWFYSQLLITGMWITSLASTILVSLSSSLSLLLPLHYYHYDHHYHIMLCYKYCYITTCNLVF